MDNEDESSRDTPQLVSYEFALSHDEAQAGATKVLTRNGKRLEVRIPAGARNHQIVRLRNAQRITDGHDGDILIHVVVSPHTSTAGSVNAVTDASFEHEVLKADLPVLVDFWAPWCAPCRALAPITESFASEYAERMKFCKLNVDENPLASRRYQVASIPSIIFFNRGLIADVAVGAMPAAELKARIEAVLKKSGRR